MLFPFYPWIDHLGSAIFGFLVIFTNPKRYNGAFFLRQRYLHAPLQCRLTSSFGNKLLEKSYLKMPGLDLCASMPWHSHRTGCLRGTYVGGCGRRQSPSDAPWLPFLEVQMQPTDFLLLPLHLRETSFTVCLKPIWCLKNDFHHQELPGCRWVNSSPVPISPLS